MAVASWFGEILGKHTPSRYDYAGITSNLRMIYVIFRLCSNAKRIHIQTSTLSAEAGNVFATYPLADREVSAKILDVVRQMYTFKKTL